MVDLWDAIMIDMMEYDGYIYIYIFIYIWIYGGLINATWIQMGYNDVST